MMRKGQRNSISIVLVFLGIFLLGTFNLSAQTEDLLTPQEARRRIKEDEGIKYREDELVKSVEEGNLELARLFLIAGKDVNAEKFSGESLLLLAAKNGDLDMFKLLLEYKPDLDTAGGFANKSALIVAAEQGRLQMVKSLLSGGAKLETADRDGNTALLMAAAKNQPEIVTLLIERGADLAVKNNYDKSPMQELFIKEIETGNVERVRFFLDAGMSADAKKALLQTPAIVLAAEQGNLALVKLLEEFGADPNQQDKLGKTALMIAAANENHELLYFLLEHGADAQNQAKYGKNPVEKFFISRVEAGDLESVSKLLKAGIDPNTKRLGSTPLLHIAVENNHTELVGTLLHFGADVDSTDLRNKTAFDIAVEKGNPDIQKLLQKALDIKLEK